MPKMTLKKSIQMNRREIGCENGRFRIMLRAKIGFGISGFEPSGCTTLLECV